jgi:hypothetical protein
MTDSELADVLIERLNKLIQDEAIRGDVVELMYRYVPATSSTRSHPTIQTDGGSVNILGLLNGLVGVIPNGKGAGWGYITAIYEDDGLRLLAFERTDKKKSEAKI